MNYSIILSILIWMLFVGIAFGKAWKKSKGSRRSSVSINRNFKASGNAAKKASNVLARKLSGSIPSRQALIRKPFEKTGELKLDSSIMLMEDREHDWLAKQLKEESEIMRRGDYLDLGAGHDANCDARMLKAHHAIEHDDSIDDGIQNTSIKKENKYGFITKNSSFKR